MLPIVILLFLSASPCFALKPVPSNKKMKQPVMIPKLGEPFDTLTASAENMNLLDEKAAAIDDPIAADMRERGENIQNPAEKEMFDQVEKIPGIGNVDPSKTGGLLGNLQNIVEEASDGDLEGLLNGESDEILGKVQGLLSGELGKDDEEKELRVRMNKDIAASIAGALLGAGIGTVLGVARDAKPTESLLDGTINGAFLAALLVDMAQVAKAGKFGVAGTLLKKTGYLTTFQKLVAPFLPGIDSEFIDPKDAKPRLVPYLADLDAVGKDMGKIIDDPSELIVYR